MGPSFGLAHLEAAAGNAAEARRILAELTAARSTRVVSAWGTGAVHASLGDIDDAFQWLETAIAEPASGLILLRVHPRLDPIRGEPRYWPMVERVRLGGTGHTGSAKHESTCWLGDRDRDHARRSGGVAQALD